MKMKRYAFLMTHKSALQVLQSTYLCVRVFLHDGITICALRDTSAKQRTTSAEQWREVGLAPALDPVLFQDYSTKQIVQNSIAFCACKL